MLFIMASVLNWNKSQKLVCQQTISPRTALNVALRYSSIQLYVVKWTCPKNLSFELAIKGRNLLVLGISFHPSLLHIIITHNQLSQEPGLEYSDQLVNVHIWCRETKAYLLILQP